MAPDTSGTTLEILNRLNEAAQGLPPGGMAGKN